jgi:hypothetical protein
MRFYLELPAGTPINQLAELWVRLVPHEGEKFLAHTNVDLGMPGRFASSEGAGLNDGLANEPAAGPLSVEGATSIPVRASASILESDWSIARPGEPANLPSAEEIATGGWRTSSEPIANVAQASAIMKPKPPVIQQAGHVEDLSESKPARAYRAPTWSPERSRDVAAHSDGSAASDSSLPQLPSWSATR